jgi:hypothetical protein
MPIRRRTSIGSTSLEYMSCPWNEIRPSTRAPTTRSFMRFRDRSTVDLPQPDGPISAVISCLPKSSVTSVTARKLP